MGPNHLEPMTDTLEASRLIQVLRDLFAWIMGKVKKLVLRLQKEAVKGSWTRLPLLRACPGSLLPHCLRSVPLKYPLPLVGG